MQSLIYTVSKHIKGSKELYLLGLKHSLQIFWVIPLSSYKTTLKEQLNGEKVFPRQLSLTVYAS